MSLCQKGRSLKVQAVSGASSPPGAQQPWVPSGLPEPAMVLMLVLRTWSLTFLDCRLKTTPAITRQSPLHTRCRLNHHRKKCDWKLRMRGIYNECDFYPHQALEVKGISPCRHHVGTKSNDFGELLKTCWINCSWPTSHLDYTVLLVCVTWEVPEWCAAH